VTDGVQPTVVSHGGSWSADLVWYDRSGTAVPFTLDRAFDELRLSPAGDRVLVDILDPDNGGRDLWMFRVRDAAPRRLTQSANDEASGVWFPDGQTIAFRSDRQGPPDVLTLALEGAGQQNLLLHQNAVLQPTDITRAADRLIYVSASRTTDLDLWTLALDAEAEPMVFLQTPASEWGGRFSPDGRWIAFVSDESGRYEVYVAPWDAPGARRPVSVGGGVSPRWRRDGKELFYLALDWTVMAVSVDWDPQLRLGPPTALFQAEDPIYRGSWDVMPDGQRFLLNTIQEDPRRDPIDVLMNWTTLLEEHAAR
jgi:hypothetical protein